MKQSKKILKMKKTTKKTKKNIKKKGGIQGKYFRLIIPNLTEFGEHPWNQDEIKKLKESTLELILKKEEKRSLIKYSIAIQKHVSGYPHLDILLIYKKKVENSYGRYDYLIKHGNLTKYRSLNKAILQYNLKEDKEPLKNFEIKQIIIENKASNKKGLYQILEEEMLKDPFIFDPNVFIHKQKLNSSIINIGWQSVIKRIKIEQTVVCNEILINKPGIKLITPQLIKKKLTSKELKTFYNCKYYQVIVDHINQISKYGYERPHKTKNLFIYGPPNTGKTSLSLEIKKHCPVYHLGTKNGWFPCYKHNIYKMMTWDEFNLKTLPYPDLLKLLEGIPMSLPIKGGHAPRKDNQLIIANSNCSLTELINFKFKTIILRKKSQLNLNARFTIVKLKKSKPLFLLLKLIESN